MCNHACIAPVLFPRWLPVAIVPSCATGFQAGVDLAGCTTVCTVHAIQTLANAGKKGMEQRSRMACGLHPGRIKKNSPRNELAAALRGESGSKG